MKLIPMKGGDEYDAFTGWRRLLYWKRGELKKIKRKHNKRIRRYLKSQERGGQDGEN